jgi:hypothetical protein
VDLGRKATRPPTAGTYADGDQTSEVEGPAV